MFFGIDLCGVRASIVMKKAKSLLMTMIALLSMPVSAHALGFGVPVLKSHLNEILDVRIPLLLLEGESLNSVFIDFAKPNEYRLVGLEPYTNLSGMRVSIEHMQGGKIYVLLSSVAVVQAPIVSVLLKARIGHNTYYKQVQLLLDTMELGARTHAVAQSQKSQEVLSNGTTAKPTSDAGQGWARTWRYGPVRSGDSLSTIAYRLRKDKQWSNHDVMLALYRFNPDAFIQHDINRLKSGVWLEIPREKMLKALLKQAPKPYEILKRKIEYGSKKLVKPVRKVESILPKVKQGDASSQLRYVGRIALGEDTHATPPSEPVSKGSEELQKQLNQLYQQAMDDHLQMASLDQNLMAIRDDIGQLGADIITLTEQQKMMQQQMADSPTTQYWMQGFLLLCILNIILIVAFLYRRHQAEKKEKYDIEEVYFKKRNKEIASIKEPVTPPAKKEEHKKYLLENKIYDIENYLNLRDYGTVESIFKQFSEAELDHFGVCALKARLYHETGNLDERDAFIRHKQASLDGREWNLLCDRLPINLWHALHEAGVIKDNGTLVSTEELPKTDTAASEQVSVNNLRSDVVDMDALQLPDVEENRDDTQPTMPLLEPGDLSELNAETVDISNDFLDLDENEFKGVNDQLSSTPEDDVSEEEFISTVFVTTLDGKKKLL